MKKENERCSQQSDDEAVWGALLSSIIALITAALMVLQKVGKRAGGRFCQASSFDFTKTISKLSELSKGECCFCKQKYPQDNVEKSMAYGKQYQLQAAPPPKKTMRESQTELSAFRGPPQKRGACKCYSQFLDDSQMSTPISNDFDRQFYSGPPEDSSYGAACCKCNEQHPIDMDIEAVVSFEQTHELTAEALHTTDTQTPILETETKGIQYEREKLVDRDSNTDKSIMQNQCTNTECPAKKQQEIQSQPSVRNVCVQPSCNNNTTMGTQKTLTFGEPVPVNCETIETLTCDPSDYYHQPQSPNMACSSEYFGDDDEEDEYDDYEGYEDPSMYMSPQMPYRPETHCIRPGSPPAKSCPESCQVPAMRRVVQSQQSYSPPMYPKKYKPQGLSDAMRTKVRFPPPSSYGYRRPMSTYSPQSLPTSQSPYASRQVTKIPCPFLDHKPIAKKPSPAKTPESQSEELDKCSCTGETSSISSNKI